MIQVHSALETLRTEEATFVYPYDGIFGGYEPHCSSDVHREWCVVYGFKVLVFKFM